VGKTTTAVNLATGLAAIGKKTLLVDFDPQGNASTGLSIDKSSKAKNIYHVLCGMCELQQIAQKSIIPNLEIAPATVDLAGSELELVNVENREHVLKSQIDSSRSYYDYMIIDCPPSLGLLTLNAMVASDSLLVPLQCEFYALEGLSYLLRTYELVKKKLNPSLDLMGVVLTMYDKRNKLAKVVEEDVRGVLGRRVFDTVIPRNVKVSEAPSHGKPAIIYDMKCAGSQAYLMLAKELLRRERESNKSKEKVAA